MLNYSCMWNRFSFPSFRDPCDEPDFGCGGDCESSSCGIPDGSASSLSTMYFPMGAMSARPPARPSPLSYIETVERVRRSLRVETSPNMEAVLDRAGTTYSPVGKATLLSPLCPRSSEFRDSGW